MRNEKSFRRKQFIIAQLNIRKLYFLQMAFYNRVGKSMSQSHYWWYVYGYFQPGDGGLPHIGQVIRYYRQLAELNKEDVAHLLGCTKRYVEMLESKNNLTRPELISRRVLLAKVLHIPPILLGLSSLSFLDGQNTTFSSIQELMAAETITDARMLAFYEGMLSLSWEFYYTSSIQRAAKTIDTCFSMLNEEMDIGESIQRDQIDALRCRFYRLSALVAREQLEIDKALEHINQAVLLASRLRNAELIAASLVGRIRIYFYKQWYEQALQDAEAACYYADADLLRDPLKGKCYQMAGEAQAYLAGDNKALQEKSLAYFDKAGRIARRGNLEADGSFVKTDLTSIYIERAKALSLFGRFHEAHNAFAIARKKLSPELIRWQINLLIEEAKTYFAEGDVTSCCLSLIDVLPLIHAINLHNRKGIISRLLEKSRQREPYNEAVKQLEKTLATYFSLTS
ncbi:MAG TPA: helix-turn-helix transcriptional regulator [Ktedonobacteraceae bacterium]|nr:helix-turn-helix transcriptional regulator [Ktedonobacteraceae bacterium]